VVVKVQAIFSLPAETVTELRARAATVGASYSALADLFLRTGLAKVPDAALRSWAEGQRQARVRAPVNRPKASELKALAVLTSEWQDAKATRAAAEQGEAVHWRALKGLEARGLAEMLVPDAPVHTDPRTKRPVSSQWRKVVTP
jgi:hypothetical protein